MPARTAGLVEVSERRVGLQPRLQAALLLDGHRVELALLEQLDHALTAVDLRERRLVEVEVDFGMLRPGDVYAPPPANDADRHAQARMGSLLDVISLLTGWMDDVKSLPDERLIALLKLGGRVARVLEATDRFQDIVTGKGRRRALPKEG